MHTIKNKLIFLSIITFNFLIVVLYLKYDVFQNNENYLKLSDELAQKLKLNADLNEKLIESELKFKTLYEDLSKLEHTTYEKLNKLIIKTDEVLLTNKSIPLLSNPIGCQANRGVIEKHVAFNKPFTFQPKVFSSFTLVDFAEGSDHRLKMNISNVTTEGFNITIATWCNTKMSKVRANWIAFGY